MGKGTWSTARGATTTSKTATGSTCCATARRHRVTRRAHRAHREGAGVLHDPGPSSRAELLRTTLPRTRVNRVRVDTSGRAWLKGPAGSGLVGAFPEPLHGRRRRAN